MDDEALKEWAQMIWGAEEYGHNSLKTIKGFIMEYERDGIATGTDMPDGYWGEGNHAGR